MRACQDHGIWHVEHLAKLWEALSSFSILTYCSAGLVAQRSYLLKEHPADSSLQYVLVAQDAAEHGKLLAKEG